MRFIIFILLIQAISSNGVSQNITKTVGKQQFKFLAGEWQKIGVDGKMWKLDNEMITVKFKGDPNQDFFQRHRLSVIRKSVNGFYDLNFPKDLSIIDVMERISAESQLIEMVEANTIGQYGFTPNDPQATNQWYLSKIGMPTVWDRVKGNSCIQVAIIDSGIDIAHEDIGKGTDNYDNLWRNIGEDQWADPNNPATGNGIDDDGNGLVDDWRGWDFVSSNNDVRSPNNTHGTIVSGIVSAKLHNNKGIAGIGGGNNSRGLELMMLGVGDINPSSAAVDDAILYAIQKGADVIQMSLIVDQNSAIDNAIQTAINNGIPVICAAGNQNTAVSYPANNPNVIAVGATDINDVKATFSNFGPELFISAPGFGIVSTQLNNTYNQASGTSFAAPIASAIVALLKCVNPNLNVQQIKDILRNTADKVGGENYNYNPSKPGHSLGLGYGRINASAAINAALPVIGGIATVCISTTYSVNNPPGSTVSWSTSNPAGLTINSSTGFATRVNDFIGNVSILATIVISGNCSYQVERSVYVLGPPLVSNNTLIFPSGQRGIDPVTLCPGCGYNFLVDNVPNASTYSWILPSGFSFLSGRNTATPAIKVSNSAGFYTLFCQIGNLCGTAYTRSLGINVSNGGGQQQRVTVYPNPTSSSLNIEIKTNELEIDNLPADDSVFARLYDKNRNQVKNGFLRAGKLILDIKDLDIGIYYLHVVVGGDLLTYQILVQR